MKLADAKARFSEVVETAMLGDTIIITKENRPVVRITAIKPAKRKLGQAKGIWMAPGFRRDARGFRGVHVSWRCCSTRMCSCGLVKIRRSYPRRRAKSVLNSECFVSMVELLGDRH